MSHDTNNGWVGYCKNNKIVVAKNMKTGRERRMMNSRGTVPIVAVGSAGDSITVTYADGKQVVWTPETDRMVWLL